MADDISGILNRIKENITAVESGRTDAPILLEIERDYLELIELVKLFLISERDSYYGYFLMNMQFWANFCVNSIAGIKLNTFPPVFEANPLLLCRFALKEILYIVCHEIDHVVLNHPAEMVKANPEQDEDAFYRFNLAADAAVNDRINYEIKAEKHFFLSQPEGIITSAALSKMFRLGKIPERESYAYYFRLIQKKNSPESGMPNGQQRIMDANSSGQQTDGDEQIVTAGNCGKMQDHCWEAGDDTEDAAAAVREFVNAAMATMSEESRGLMPAHFLSQVEKLNRPPQIAWQSVLKKYIGTVTAEKRKTRTRLNRRQPDRFDLSGNMDDKILKIVAAIDTSASVDNRMIGFIFDEIFAILAKRKHDITVIECDAEVQRVYTAKTRTDIRLKVAGRGGTRFSPVIEYINNDRHLSDALLIYFTDGYGEREIPRPRTYRNIWVVFDDVRNLSVKEPYGTVLCLKQEE